MLPNLLIEQAHCGPVAGIDEAGRGPWAGPVVAAAVIASEALEGLGIDDCKRLSPARRMVLAQEIRARAPWGLGLATVQEIDRLNILRANDLAMARAVAALPLSPAYCLVDGKHLPPLPCPARWVVGGDGLCLSIAAASILAKVHRDALMDALAVQHPAYGWARNKGYGTSAHQAALAAYGPTEHHRRSFAPIRRLLERE